MSILGDAIPGARVLDLCAGSGALGLECLSRGAASAILVERSPTVLPLLRRNVAALGVEDRVQITLDHAIRAYDRLAPGAVDIVLADPPYAGGLAADLLARFRERPIGTILAVEHAWVRPLDGDDTRRYGDTAVTFCYAR